MDEEEVAVHIIEIDQEIWDGRSTYEFMMLKGNPVLSKMRSVLEDYERFALFLGEKQRTAVRAQHRERDETTARSRKTASS